MNIPEVPGAASRAEFPQGLPDPAALARLAGEFFAALPRTIPAPEAGHSIGNSPYPAAPPIGGVPLPSNPQPPGLSLPPGTLGPSTPSAIPFGTPLPGANVIPSSPASLAHGLASAPALVPHAMAPNGLPDHVLQAAPSYDSRLGGVVLGVPEAYAATDPISGSAPRVADAGTRSNPFYHLADAQQLSGTAPLIDDQRLSDHHNLAGSGPVPAIPAHSIGTTAPGMPAPRPHFYFLEPSLSGIHDVPGGIAAPAIPAPAHPGFDVHAVRRDFPILQERVNGRPLVWFDNAATTQKPQSVIDRIAHFYAHENSNIHRAAHQLAARATDAYEKARDIVRRFIGAGSVDEIVFLRGTTEAINLVSKGWGAAHIGAGDEIVVSHLEHHANIVPWQQLAAEKGARIRVIPVDDDGQVLLDEYQKLLNDRTRIVAVTQVSNALGTVVPVKEIIDIAHRRGIRTLLDGAQSVSHMRVDVQELDTDFFVFSGHKILGPTGIGVLYAKKEVLDDMPPWQGGGNMIRDVSFEKTTYQDPPARFEAGTGNIADAVGLGAALEYVERIGIENIRRYEHELLAYATRELKSIPGVRLIGTARDKASVLSFVLAGHSTDEVGQALNREGIAVRTGHHCAQPILRRFGVETTVRPSLAFYNTYEEVDRFIAVVRLLARNG